MGANRFFFGWVWPFTVAMALLLLSCGSEPGRQVQTGVNRTVSLALFGAPWCQECKRDLPEIQALLNALTPEQSAAISVHLYVTTTGNPAVAATDASAIEYRDALKLSFPASADAWRWQKFRKYVGGNLALPGAAVLDEDGNVLRAFRAGATSFDPGEIVRFAVRALQ